jgi:hypothetical protein
LYSIGPNLAVLRAEASKPYVDVVPCHLDKGLLLGRFWWDVSGALPELRLDWTEDGPYVR